MKELLNSLRERLVSILFVDFSPADAQTKRLIIAHKPEQTRQSDSSRCAYGFAPPSIFFIYLRDIQARAYEQAISDMGIHARSLVNSFHITVRTPPEIFDIISSYLTEDDLFSASQVCQHWRTVLTSSASLWTRISCNHGPRAIASLERCGPLPIQLRFKEPFPSEVLEKVLLHGNKIASLNAGHDIDQISQLQQLFAFSRPSVEQLLLYTADLEGRAHLDRAVPGMWQGFTVLRGLFVMLHSVPIHRLTAPNLVHLALECTGSQQDITVESILDMLRRFPLLGTLLLGYADSIPQVAIHAFSPVRLSHLRSLEVGSCEVHSGLITHLDFPPDLTVGFRLMNPGNLWGQVSNTILYAMRHVLQRIKIRSITLAAHLWNLDLLIRFEGPHGSLEISTEHAPGGPSPINLLLDPQGVLFSHSPHIKDVTEINFLNCTCYTYQHRNQELDYIKIAMPNVDTISLFRCEGDDPLALLTTAGGSSPPFPRLERIMVLGHESRLEEMVRNRRDLGVPLKTLILGRDPEGFNYDRLEDYATLEGLVDLRVGCPVEIVEWGAGNEILDVWSAAGAPSAVSPKTKSNSPRSNNFCS